MKQGFVKYLQKNKNLNKDDRPLKDIKDIKIEKKRTSNE